VLFIGELVNVKVYNINKEQLTISIKNYSLFNNYSIEELRYIEDRLRD